MGEKGNKRVGGRADCSEITIATRLKKGISHFGRIRERVDQVIDLPEIPFHRFSNLRDRISLDPFISFVLFYLVRYISRCVIERIERVDSRKFH